MQAQRFAETRHKTKPKARKWNPDLESYVIDKIKYHWSPEQISGRLSQEDKLTLTAETIYRFLLAEQKAGRVSIDERPAIVDEKSRLGDWEADLVVGAKGQGAIVTLVERRSWLY